MALAFGHPVRGDCGSGFVGALEVCGHLPFRVYVLVSSLRVFLGVLKYFPANRLKFHFKGDSRVCTVAASD